MKNSFKELKVDELVVKRNELRKKYFDFRFQSVVGHVENPVQARVLRRQIARLETRITNAGGSGVAAEKPGAAVAKAPAAATVGAAGAARTKK
jgi:large subunit ribosomal protein L29